MDNLLYTEAGGMDDPRAVEYHGRVWKWRGLILLFDHGLKLLGSVLAQKLLTLSHFGSAAFRWQTAQAHANPVIV